MSASSAVPVDAKSGKKRKSKTEAVAVASPAGRASPSVDSGLNGHTVEQTTAMDSPYIKEIAKNIRNLHKKLNSSAKADSVVEQNPNISLDDLVAQKKLNADQKAQLTKKPQLQAQLAQLEEQQKHYTSFAQELQDKFDKEKAALVESHEAQLVQAKQEVSDLADTNKTDDTEKSLTVITGFLHAAAAKRQSEDQDSEEAKAFEGALLLVYQGNAQSLNTLKSLVEGSGEKVIDVEGNTLDFTFAQINEAALRDASVLVDEVETTPTLEEDPAEPDTDLVTDTATDPTIAHAGLTELEDTTTVPITSNGDIEVEEETAAPNQTSAGEEASNAVADAAWDPQASITSTQTTGDEYVMVPRDLAETETPSHAPAVQQSTSNWADETAAEEKAVPENDGFEQVKRERGRGRGGPRGGRGFEGRGRGNRGRGEYRGGEHRGGEHRGGEHRGGEYRGRGGQGRGGRGGRGARGDSAPQAAPAPQAS